MLDARAEPAKQETAQEGGEAARQSRGHEAEGRDGGARGEEPGLAPPLGEDARGDLKDAMPPLYTVLRSPTCA